MLIAEELLLLLTDEESGSTRTDSTKLTYSLAGALLLELSLMGRVDVAEPGEPTKKGRLVVRDGSPTGEALLDHALTEVERRRNLKPTDVIRRLAKGAREDVYARLADEGVVRREDSRVLGVFPRTRWPVIDRDARRRLERDVAAAVSAPTELPIQPRVAALVSLLQAIDKLAVVATPELTGMSKREIGKRGKQISEESWAPKAVRDAVAAVNAAIMAGAVVAATAGATASS
jgi:hypothetical protein